MIKLRLKQSNYVLNNQIVCQAINFHDDDHLEGELSFFASAVGLDDDVSFSFGGIIEGAVHGLARHPIENLHKILWKFSMGGLSWKSNVIYILTESFLSCGTDRSK